MRWTVEFPGSGDHAVVTTSGTFSVDDHRRMIEDIVSRPEWRPGTDVLFDHRDLIFGDADVRSMTEARGNHLEYEERIGNGKAAILMGCLTDYGRGRQFEMLTDESISARLCIFLDPAEARDWLLGRQTA
jgi:hypothetical protein